LPEGGGDRNAIPIYTFPNAHVVHHFIPAMPVRVSAMRALGAYHNVFSIESFIDELAVAASADPVEFRAEASRRSARAGRDRQGGASVRLAEGAKSARRPRLRPLLSRATRNLAAYCAIASEVEVNKETGRPRWCARWRRSIAVRWSIRMG